MKKVILNTSDEYYVCDIPDNIYNDLSKYFDKYTSWADDNGSKMNFGSLEITVLDIEEFIDWLNKNELKDEKASVIENIGIIDSEDKNTIPGKYRDIEIKIL